jgi:release factor glutamine methyltransferase
MTPPGPPTIGTALAAAVTRLTAAGMDSPHADARRLLSHALAEDGRGDDPLRLVTERETPLPAAVSATFQALLTRRLAHEPVARIIGTRWFYGRPFEITPATLDPRPDSETLIELSLELLRDAGTAPLRLLDVGTGSGCLLLTLLAARPEATGIGTDVAPSALQTAARNAAALGLAGRCAWRQGPDFTPITADEAGHFDLIVANPPYIPTAALAALDPDVRLYDPPAALDGGPDGLAMYRRLAFDLQRVQPDGWIAVEVGAGQDAAVANLLRAAWPGREVEVRTARDLAGRIRCVAARPRPSAVR